MCQPGRPSPHGDGQAGSPGFADFHNTKSSGSRLAVSTSTREPARRSSSFLPDSFPYGANLCTSYITSPFARLVGVTVVDELADHRQHLVDVFGGPGLFLRPQAAELVEILVHGRGELRRMRAPVDARLLRAVDDLVVDVGDVAHVGHAQAAVPQVAAHHVEHHEHAGVAHVEVVVDRDAAAVHAHVAGLDGLEFLLLARQGIVYADHAANLFRRSWMAGVGHGVQQRRELRAFGRAGEREAQRLPQRLALGAGGGLHRADDGVELAARGRGIGGRAEELRRPPRARAPASSRRAPALRRTPRRASARRPTAAARWAGWRR